LNRVLGDQRLQVSHLLADRPVLRMVADTAALTHRNGVLPRGQKQLVLGA
jgi:hypothetical protein